MEESKTLTRTPIEAEEAPVVQSSSSKDENRVPGDGAQPSPSELVGLGRPPYVVDLLKARPAYETFDTKKTLQEVDEFIRDGIEDSRTSYEEAFNGIKANLKETDDIYTLIAQLKDYVRLQSKVRELIKEKEEFEAKDPEIMSAEELKRLLNGTGRH